MLVSVDVKEMKVGNQKLFSMKNLVNYMERATLLVVIPLLLLPTNQYWSWPDTVKLYEVTQHSFQFTLLNVEKVIRFDTIW